MTSLIDRDSLSIVKEFIGWGEKYDKVVKQFTKKKSKFLCNCNNCKKITNSWEYCGTCFERICTQCLKTENERKCCN